jgi:hypothetical protein
VVDFKRNGKSVSVEPTLLKISDGLSLRYGKVRQWPASRPPPHNPHPARVFPSAGAVKPKSAANADLRYEHAKKRGALTALLSAYNLFGDSFFEASCCLGGKTAGHFLRIFKHIERIHLAPSQGEHVETMVEV